MEPETEVIYKENGIPMPEEGLGKCEYCKKEIKECSGKVESIPELCEIQNSGEKKIDENCVLCGKQILPNNNAYGHCPECAVLEEIEETHGVYSEIGQVCLYCKDERKPSVIKITNGPFDRFYFCSKMCRDNSLKEWAYKIKLAEEMRVVTGEELDQKQKNGDRELWIREDLYNADIENLKKQIKVLQKENNDIKALQSGYDAMKIAFSQTKDYCDRLEAEKEALRKKFDIGEDFRVISKESFFAITQILFKDRIKILKQYLERMEKSSELEYTHAGWLRGLENGKTYLNLDFYREKEILENIQTGRFDKI